MREDLNEDQEMITAIDNPSSIWAFNVGLDGSTESCRDVTTGFYSTYFLILSFFTSAVEDIRSQEPHGY
jgi:hypothetical protein